MSRLITVHDRYFDDDGSILTGGKLYFYETGTLTPKTTYSDEDLTTPNSNPVILDAWGIQGDVWYEGKARVRVYNSNDVLVRDMDPVYAVSGGGGGGGSGSFIDNDVWRWYTASVSYSENSLVVSPTTHKWYQSTQDDNLNNSLTNTTYWKEIGPIFIWNTLHTYQTNYFAYYSGLLYRSRTDSNTGNNPISDKTNWEALGNQMRYNDEGTITNGSTVTLDLTEYNRFKITKAGSADITVAFSNAPATNEDYVFDIMLVNGAGGFDTITWPAGVQWPYNTEPTWSLSGTDVVTFIKYYGEDVYHGSLYTAGSA